MLKFVLDVGVGKKVQQFLIESGFDTISILDINPSMADDDILSIAGNQSRMVITMDKDFGELVFRSGKPHYGVLLLRLEDANGSEKVDVFNEILKNYLNELEGKFTVFQNGRLRIRQ
jgi:predicted nuclease of predicted toxin-antitoxin system